MDKIKGYGFLVTGGILLIALASLVIVSLSFNFFMTGSRFNALEARMDKIEIRMDKIETRMESIETKLDSILFKLKDNSHKQVNKK